MGFRDNLQHLRRTRNMTQEQLAMLVGVSRQSVTKWEAERAYPEMDKLMKLCDIFGCSLDDLVKGDLTDTSPAPTEVVASGPASDICGYDAHMRSRARSVALAIFVLCLGGVGGILTSHYIPGEGPTAVALFAGAFLGLAILIPTGLNYSEFKRAHPFIGDFYTPEDRRLGTSLLARLLIIGIGIIFIGVAGAAFLDSATTDATGELAGAWVIGFGGLGASVMAYAGIMQSRFNIAAYNNSKDADADPDDFKLTGRAKKLVDAICIIIMLIASVIAMFLLYFGPGGLNDYFWLAWVVGGILCAIVSIIFSVLPESK